MIIARDHYLNHLISHMNNGLIKVKIGIRSTMRGNSGRKYADQTGQIFESIDP